MILSFCSLDKEFWLLVVIDDEAIDGSPEIDDAFEDAALQTPESRLAAWQLTWRFDLMPLAKSFLPALLVLSRSEMSVSISLCGLLFIVAFSELGHLAWAIPAMILFSLAGLGLLSALLCGRDEATAPVAP